MANIPLSRHLYSHTYSKRDGHAELTGIADYAALDNVLDAERKEKLKLTKSSQVHMSSAARILMAVFLQNTRHCGHLFSIPIHY